VKLILDRADMFQAERFAKRRPTPENYLELCRRYEQNWRYRDWLAACRNALRLRTNYAEAYDQLAVAHVDLEQWDEAAEAAQRALELDPTLPRAKFNLERAQREMAALADELSGRGP
jgi:tetratricopeptide (TPR) repeat protein